MNKKRIAFIANDMTVGGVEQALVKLSKVLDYDKYSYVLWLVQKEGPLLDKLDSRMEVRELGKAVPVIQLLCHGKIRSFVRGICSRTMARRYAGNWRLNQWYTAQCTPRASEEFECVIAYHGTTSAVTASALYNIKAKKRVLWVHGDHRIAPEDIRFFHKQYRKFDKIYCVSQAIRYDFINLFPNTAEKTAVFHNIVDCEEIRRKAQEPIEIQMKSPSLVTVGRLAKEKGQEMIPETVRMLLDNGCEVYWYLVGDGDKRTEIEESIIKYSVEKNVFLLGTKENPYPYMKNGEIYVQPSLSEGWGLTVQEAKTLGKITVVMPIPAMYEQIHEGVNGIICKAATPAALAVSLKNLIENPEIQSQVADALSRETCNSAGEISKLYEFIS